ncbi:TetR/AcrR family transcriptional regulator [Halobaculum lipolyticum]|uniref:TetR/AcrR family transcriptional regulator n=1 Tax=Halobaculum lipolyticum TaxID=3032001 RepID=A0ABD5W5V5_9EURY|nr:TetR/AcrR family transcriptional regulator [Halobaculum sp. DT31]
MDERVPVDEERGETEQRIVEATFAAIHEHGYSGLTIQRIADQFDKSKSLLYYHYDDKDEIVADLLGFALGRYLSAIDDRTTDDPIANLRVMVDELLPLDPTPEEAAGREVVMELRAQAVTDPEFRAAFTAIDDRLHDRIAGYVAEAIERDGVDGVDADAVAEQFLAVLNGALIESATADRDVVPALRASLLGKLDRLDRLDRLDAATEGDEE